MNLTNHQNLPDALVRAVAHDTYDRGDCDYTVTELIKPARIMALERAHKDELTEDAADVLYRLLGECGHEVLRRASKEALTEVRFKYTLASGISVSGKTDLIEEKGEFTLFDYKFTSIWAVKDGLKPEWEQQLNLYNVLAVFNGVLGIKNAKIVAIFRDWSIREAGRSRDYPQSQVRVLDVPLWPDSKALDFLHERIQAHEAAKTTLPECSSLDMWEKPTKWAVKKEVTSARALSVHDSLAEARAAQKNGQIIEERPGERPRCESYCVCAFACEQFKAWTAARTAPPPAALS